MKNANAIHIRRVQGGFILTYGEAKATFHPVGEQVFSSLKDVAERVIDHFSEDETRRLDIVELPLLKPVE